MDIVIESLCKTTEIIKVDITVEKKYLINKIVC